MPSATFLPPDIQNALQRVEESQSYNFCELAALGDLDPKVDFRYSDLSGTDFSNCNLSGFDFTGADLSDCRGLKVNYDETTVFDGADVSRSCFEYYCKQKSFFEENSAWLELIKRLDESHFTICVNWIADNLNKNTMLNGSNWYIASRLMHVSRNRVVRSNVLFFARPLFKQSNEHLDFLLYTLAMEWADTSLVRSVTSALASIHYKNSAATKSLFMLMRHTDVTVRRHAITGILNGPNVLSSRSEAIELIRLEANSENRRYFLSRLCRRLENTDGSGWVHSTKDPYKSGVAIDFVEPVDEAKIRSIARRWLQSSRFSSNAGQRLGNSLNSRAHKHASLFVVDREDDLEQQTTRVRATLRRLEQYGIPLNFDNTA